MNTMQAARLHAIGDLRCDTVEIPVPHGDEILLRVHACGICGSDLPRVFQHGSSNGKYPLTIGHEFAGEVAAVGETADASLIGARGAVFPLIPCRRCDSCLTGHYAMCESYDYLGSRRDGGFAQYCLLPSAWHLIRSQSASMETLAMAEPACVAQHAVRQSGVTAGQLVIIFGAGPIGMMAAQWARIFGARALLADISAGKTSFARAQGFDAINVRESNAVDEIRARNGGRLADAAIEGTGAGSALEGCIAGVRARGTIALLGNPMGDTQIAQSLHSQLLRKEIRINGVWNSSRAPYPIDEWAYTVQMMDAGIFRTEGLITDRLSLNALPAAMEDIRAGIRSIVKAMVIV